MRWSRYLEVAAIGACALVTSACDFELFCATCPVDPIKVSGEVLDDSLDLPPDSQARIPLEGVRVEVLEGPDKGKVAISDAFGRYDLGPVSLISVTTSTRLRASKEGWLSKDWSLAVWARSPTFHLSQPPHVVWGCFALGQSGGVPVPPAGIRVQIVGGPAAGRVALTDGNGRYRFDDLATQAQFSIDVSKAGYRTSRYLTYGDLAGNQSVPTTCVTLQAE